MQDKLQGMENTPTVTERRACPRLRPTSLMYIDIGNVNGGIVTSLSENGLAFTAAATLGNGELGDGPLQMRIQFPGIPEAMEANGEIVWTSSSGKEACMRFVEIEDKAREQIQRWISDQISINGLRPEPPKLPKMRLANSPAPKTRASRFSFSDVASTRVDSEGETGVEDLPQIVGEPAELPPAHGEGMVFRDGAEVVASAFESPAFAEEGTEKPHSPRNEDTTQATSDEKPRPQTSSSIPERRRHSRRQILLFTYAMLGEDNGGLVFNLSEGGLALTAAAALQEGHFKKIRVRFPDSEDWIETSGRLAWKNDSGKEVGIQFVGLPEDARLRIKEWVLQEEPAAGFRSEEGEARTSQSPVQELPSLMEPDGPSADLSETPASFEEQPFEEHSLDEHHFENGASASAASSSALFKTGIKGIFERASVRKRVAKIKPPRFADHPVRPGTRVAHKAMAIAAGAALAVGGWMLYQRSPSNEASGIIAQNEPDPQLSHETAQKPKIARTEGGAAGATPDPPIQPSENTATQTGTTKPTLQQIESGSPALSASRSAKESPNVGTERTPKEKPRSEEAVVHVPAPSSAPRSLDRAQRATPSQRERETRAPQITAPVSAHSSEGASVDSRTTVSKLVENKPAENKSVQVAQASPTLTLNKDANAASSTLNSNPPQPTPALPVDLEKEKPFITSKQPDPPVVARAPVVTVSFDPYPSIRIDKTKDSKKSRQGKSLQMGRLLSRVDPIYPEEAKQQGVEGTVRIHAIFNREGAVQSVISLGGPPVLVPSAMNAVRQWHYSQTILGGQAMETEEDVTVVFRLANSASKD